MGRRRSRQQTQLRGRDEVRLGVGADLPEQQLGRVQRTERGSRGELGVVGPEVANLPKLACARLTLARERAPERIAQVTETLGEGTEDEREVALLVPPVALACHCVLASQQLRPAHTGGEQLGERTGDVRREPVDELAERLPDQAVVVL